MDPITPPTSSPTMQDQIHYFSAQRRKDEPEEESEDEEDMERMIALLDSYAPLSNLPTPPSSGKTSPSLSIIPPSLSTAIPNLALMPFKAPAEALSRLVKVSGPRGPLVARILSILHRVEMEDKQIAFAGCLLNRLSWRFIRDWTRAINDLDPQHLWPTTKPVPPKPELIIVAALSIAEMWTDDYDRPSYHWVRLAEGRHTRRELAVTKRCILQDAGVDYRLQSVDLKEVEQMMGYMYGLDKLVVELGKLGLLTPDASPQKV